MIRQYRPLSAARCLCEPSAHAFLLFFRCKKPLYYAITVSMAVLIWVVFHFVLNVSF